MNRQRNNGSGGSGEAWILGTTESVTAMDPAGSYDFGSWNMQYNIFEQLLTIPAGETEPVGDAAESCAYDDPQTVTCTLRPGLKFSNGNDLTSSDVKFSLERNIAIADPNGSAVLLGQITDAKTGKVAEGAIETRTTPPWSSPQRGRHHLPQAAVDRDHVDRGRETFRGQAPRGRPDHRLRSVQAEPVQARRAGRARGQRDLRGPAHPVGAVDLRHLLR
jgi:hypothetical protein